MTKPDCLKTIETKIGTLSKMTSYKREEKFVYEFLQKKYLIVYSIASFEKNKKPVYSEIVFKTPQPFFIHMNKNENDWSMDIYYLSENYKELLFFINQIEKI